MKVGDFMTVKYLHMLAFWIGMSILNRELLQAVASRYSHVPSAMRIRTDLGFSSSHQCYLNSKVLAQLTFL